MDDYTGKNGIQVTPNKEDQVIKLYMFLDGAYTTWVEFNEEQIEGLLREIEAARAALGEKKDD
jgi:hypothetical protein